MPTSKLTGFVAVQRGNTVVIKVAGTVWASYPGTLPENVAHWVNGWCVQFGLPYIVKTSTKGTYNGESRVLALLKHI